MSTFEIPEWAQSPLLLCSFFLTPDKLGDDMVTVVVGEELKNFVVHKKLLCSEGNIFGAALRKALKDNEDGEMQLPEGRPRTFAKFVKLLYKNSLNKPNLFIPSTRHGHKEDLVLVYTSAVGMGLKEFVDKVLDFLREDWWTLMDEQPTFVTAVYRWTKPGSKLREFIACDPFWIKSKARDEDRFAVYAFLSVAENNHAFGQDISSARSQHTERLRENSSGINPFRKRAGIPDCQFHLYSPGQSCARS